MAAVLSLGAMACGGGDADAPGDASDSSDTSDDDDAGQTFELAPEEELGAFRIAPAGDRVAVVYGAEERVGLLSMDDATLTDVAPGGTYLTGLAWADDTTLLFTGDGGIFQVGADGQGLVSVDDAFAASGLDRSPDGALLAYGINGADGALLTVATSTTQALPTHCATARFSPDGQTLACDAQGELVLIDVTTLAATTLVTGLDFFAPLDWFADGDRLVFAGPDGIETVEVGTGARAPLHDAFAVIDLDLAADDSVLLYRQNGEQIIRGVTLR